MSTSLLIANLQHRLRLCGLARSPQHKYRNSFNVNAINITQLSTSAKLRSINKVSDSQTTSATQCTLNPVEQPKKQQQRWKIQTVARLAGGGLPKVYSDLSKDKLTGFVVLTAMAGYAVAPGATHIGTLLWMTAGTTLCAASANTLNQWIEVPYDAQMSRTRNRPLARHALAPHHALGFGVTAGITGVTALYVFVNPVTAALGVANIALYAGAYTAMKRLTIANTWVGSLVGAVPPLIGWAAATGGELGAGAWVLGGMMFAWQFPHFISLAYTLRADYSKAGYRMMSVTHPRLNARVALRYALRMFPLSAALVATGTTDAWFLLDSSLVNGLMAYCAYDFWRSPDPRRSRRLFFSSLVNLPVLMILIMVHKILQDRRRRQLQENELEQCGAKNPTVSPGHTECVRAGAV
ncbi:Protoheme IX farnesyltransferase, mitochondrial [Coemansia sp. RSA 1843]|nr:Protoheme IX farnesyltransferase, mitochondrial [Coemansia sp. RSA 1843]